MPVLIRLLLLAVILLAPAKAAAQAACRVQTGCAAGCTCGDSACEQRGCGGGGADHDTSAADLAAAIAERERQFQIDLAAKQAEGRAEAAESVRHNTDLAIAAADKRDWKRAIAYLEAAMLLDPFNTQTATNLEYARNQEWMELRGREAAYGPSGGSVVEAVLIATEMPTQLTPARPDAFAWLGLVRSYFSDQVSEAAEGAADDVIRSLDLSGPARMMMRYRLQVNKLSRAIPDWVTGAAIGEISPEEASRLDKRGAAIILNFGGVGEYAQQLVELGSAKAVVLDAAEKRMKQVMENGIDGLIVRAATAVGVPEEISTRALAIGKEHSARILNWIGL